MEPRHRRAWLEIAGRRHRDRVATITLWEPPHRLCALAESNKMRSEAGRREKSEVDVRFRPTGPDATRVELMPQSSRTMGGGSGRSMRKDVDGGWPGLIERFGQRPKEQKLKQDRLQPLE